MKFTDLHCTKTVLKYIVFFICFTVSNPLFSQILVAGTEFKPQNVDATKTYYGINDISHIGLQGGSLSVTPTLTPNTNAGTFNAPYHYAITDNPYNLDEARYVNNSANPEYMLVYSPKPSGGNANILQYKVVGMVPNSAVTVKVKYCSVVNSTYTGCTG